MVLFQFGQHVDKVLHTFAGDAVLFRQYGAAYFNDDSFHARAIFTSSKSANRIASILACMTDEIGAMKYGLLTS